MSGIDQGRYSFPKRNHLCGLVVVKNGWSGDSESSVARNEMGNKVVKKPCREQRITIDLEPLETWPSIEELRKKSSADKHRKGSCNNSQHRRAQLPSSVILSRTSIRASSQARKGHGINKYIAYEFLSVSLCTVRVRSSVNPVD